MIEQLLLQGYQPRSEVVTSAHRVPRARFPAIDAHNHLTDPEVDPEELDLERVLRELDSVNVTTAVNLSGGWGDELKRNVERFDLAYPGRFVTFCNVDFGGIGEPGWPARATAQLEADVRAGARGLKVFKELGLRYRDPSGRLVMPDDARLSDLWDAAGAAGVPVTIHSADPTAFFRPLDRFNERIEQLHAYPEWHFYGPEFPSFEEVIESLYRLVERHPRTSFITAHVGCYAENLGFVAQMMDHYPNLYTDISARLPELGRVPYSARKWFIDHADRILFGTDFLLPNVAMYQIYFRFLETADEYFAYEVDSPAPTEGRWNIYGLYLPDEVLRKVYRDNAARLLKLGPLAATGSP
jgi:predicted TIM-barrel fold metal-dependent hydrolase